MVVYPGTIVNENGNGVYDEIVPPRALSAPANPVVITKSVNDRTSIIVAKGCFAYLTAETTHVSAYCYKFDGSRTDLDMSKWEWRPCEVGYYAN
jgi:hypothetical protein